MANQLDPLWNKLQLGYNLFLIYDREDEKLVEIYSWHAVKRGRTWYAATRHRIHGRMVLILFHRLVTGCPHHLVVHHINGNGLDNRKRNLLKTTITQHEIIHRRCWGNTSKKTLPAEKKD